MSDQLPRQLIVCCDGTNNNLTGGRKDTHVVRLCQLLAQRDDPRQLVFYDPGVGNPGELPGATLWDQTRLELQRIAGLAFGRGVYENMAECYQFLMHHYQPGDQIFVFGFSRGAFTARSVAGLVNRFGILRPHMGSMVPTLLHIYFSDSGAQRLHPERIAAQATALFAEKQAQRVELQFVGVWDTVASVGMPPFAARFTARADVQGKRFLNVRQALALDEFRAQFAPRLYVQPNGDYTSESGQRVTLRQLWFRGAHADVGGGYTTDAMALADDAFAWLVSEASHCGLPLAPAGDAPLSETEVRRLLYPDGGPTTALAHSELCATPLWAVTGMKVRSPSLASNPNDKDKALPAEEHPSVGQRALSYPQDTVWRKPVPWGALLLWCVVFVALYGAVGQLLMFDSFKGESLWEDLGDSLQRFPVYVETNLYFVRWQMAWWWDGPAASLAQGGSVWQGVVEGLQRAQLGFQSPRWALLWDLGLIVSYAQVLSRLCVAGFARGAGLRRVVDHTPRLLNALGWALPLMVFSDLGENALTWLTITLTSSEYHAIAALTGVLMSLAALLKWVGLAGVAVLAFWPWRAASH